MPLLRSDIPIDDLRQPPSLRRSLAALAGFVAVTFSASLVGVLFRPDAWYESLAKPSWNPPNWVFGPVWTTLYLLMAVAAWLVWRRWGFRYGRGPLALYFVQLALNAAWSPLFFGGHAIGLALADLVLLWLVLLATTMVFFHRHKLAGLLLTPYLAWITFAGALNLAIWRLNAG